MKIDLLPMQHYRGVGQASDEVVSMSENIDQIKSLTFRDVYVSETAPPHVHIFRTSAYEYYSDSPRWL